MNIYKFNSTLRYFLIPKFIKYKISKKYKILNKFKLTNKSIVLDLGAHIGEVSEYFLKKNCIVHAYEPNKKCFEKLKKLSKYKNFKCHNIGLSNRKETKKLFTNDNRYFKYLSQGSSIFKLKYINSSQFQNCDFDTLDNILNDFKFVDLIKMDIEGSEYEIIDDLLNNINKFEICLIETHERKYKFFKKTHEEFIKKINKSGNKHKFRLNWV